MTHEQSAHDPVTRPSHYTFSEFEPIRVIRAWGLSFSLGNVLKYIVRAGKKGDALEDLRKARVYLEDEIAALEASRADKG